jgi:SulP family sulfate permease
MSKKRQGENNMTEQELREIKAAETKNAQFDPPKPPGFSWGKVISILSASLITGSLGAVLSISFGALIFSKDLSGYLSTGIGVTLFGSCVMGILCAFASSFPNSVTIVQDVPAAIVAVSASAVFARASQISGPDSAFATTVLLISISSACVGIFFIMLGRLKQGNLVRYIPFPVIGGFLAGTGWLLFSGGINLMSDIPMTLSSLGTLFESAIFIRWGPGFIFAAALVAMQRRFTHFMVMPAMLILAAAFFYLLLPITGTSFEKAGQMGLLLGPFKEGGLWKPITFSLLKQADYGIILSQFWSIVTIAIVSAVALLLYASGLELVARRDTDLNRELQVGGLANIFAALVGSPPGYTSVSLSTLGYKFCPDSRIVGMGSACLCGSVLVFGTSLLACFPKPIIGGMVVFLGISLLYEWLYESFFSLPWHDYLLILVILVVIGKYSFLQGVIVGLIISVVLFVINYSRINMVRNSLSGADYQSNVDRNPVERALLVRKGSQIMILKLQGYIFFGTANKLVNQISDRLGNKALTRLEFVLLDFSMVTGVDSSALNRLTRMKQIAEVSNFFLIFTHISAGLTHQFQKYGLTQTEQKIKIFPDLDHGVEWCENRILDDETALARQEDKTLLERQTETFHQAVLESMCRMEMLSDRFDSVVCDMLDYFVKRELSDNHILINQGEDSTGLYFIESGEVTARFEPEPGKAVRLRTMRSGTVVGELGMYQKKPASATIISKGECTLWHLTEENLERLEKEKPEIATAFHKYMAHLLCSRLSDTNRILQKHLYE